MDSEQKTGAVPTTTGDEVVSESSFFTDFINEIITSPLNLCLLLAIFYLIYRILQGRNEDTPTFTPEPPPLPKLKKQDFRIDELKKYDGTDESGRVLVAVNGKVYDVTRGKRFYGPRGPYSSFAGRDASRALAMFQTDLVKDEYDDLSDLTPVEMDSIREWDLQLADKYDFVGKLLKPGEEPTNYSDDEDGGDGDVKVQSDSNAATTNGDESTPSKTKKDD